MDLKVNIFLHFGAKFSISAAKVQKNISSHKFFALICVFFQKYFEV